MSDSVRRWDVELSASVTCDPEMDLFGTVSGPADRLHLGLTLFHDGVRGTVSGVHAETGHRFVRWSVDDRCPSTPEQLAATVHRLARTLGLTVHTVGVRETICRSL